MRMDVVNKTSSESFQVHQLSSVGRQWEVSILQPVDKIFPSQSLMAGQALSCFFMLKVGRRAALFTSFSCRMISVYIYIYCWGWSGEAFCFTHLFISYNTIFLINSVIDLALIII